MLTLHSVWVVGVEMREIWYCYCPCHLSGLCPYHGHDPCRGLYPDPSDHNRLYWKKT